MEQVNIREMKARLCKYLRRVEKGESFLITNHGRPVAELKKTELVYFSLPPPSFLQKLLRWLRS